MFIMGFLSNELQNSVKRNINIEVELREDTGCGKSANAQGKHCGVSCL